MDSTLGKILSSILGLLALAGVVVLGYYGMAHHKTDSAVADVASLAVNVRATYVNNPAGFASLTNAVAVGAGGVPASMLQGGHIVNAWGSSVTLGPVPGYPKDFYIDLGAVPQTACVRLLTADADLMGAAVGGAQVALPVDPAAAATACAGAATATGVPMTVQYGQSRVPVCLSTPMAWNTPGVYTVPVSSACGSAKVTLRGAGGGAGANNRGGNGGLVSAVIPVSKLSGRSLTIVVGEAGAPGTSNGGGLSAVCDGPCASATALAVAGGGGGGPAPTTVSNMYGSGENGGNDGASGTYQYVAGETPWRYQGSGYPGTTTAGGGGGVGYGYMAGTPGISGAGGSGSTASGSSAAWSAQSGGVGGGAYAGGGGGGFYGGGGGGFGGGGGGGADFLSTAVTSGTITVGAGGLGWSQGQLAQAGSVTITWGP